MMPELIGRHGQRVALRRDRGLRSQDTLFPCEAAAVAAAVEKRRREFRSGRASARAALAALGLPRQAIPVGLAGEPAWPAGIVGSISHCDDEAVAAVGRVAEIRAIGIDVETTAPLCQISCDRICNDADRALRDARAPSLPVCWSSLVFSAKEALFKACFSLCRQSLDIDGVAVRVDGGERHSAEGTFRAVPLTGDPIDLAFCDLAEGRWAVRDNHIYCAAICGRSPFSQVGNEANPRWTS